MVNVTWILVGGGLQAAKTNNINGNSSVKQQLNNNYSKKCFIDLQAANIHVH
jgi:hypothetical protein